MIFYLLLLMSFQGRMTFILLWNKKKRYFEKKFRQVFSVSELNWSYFESVLSTELYKSCWFFHKSGFNLLTSIMVIILIVHFQKIITKILVCWHCTASEGLENSGQLVWTTHTLFIYLCLGTLWSQAFL